MFCPHCGAKNSEDTDFCKMCGKRLNDTVEEVTRPQPDQTNLPRINNTPVNPSEISKKTVAIVCSICGTIAVVAIVVGAIFIFGSNKAPDNSSINQNAPAPTNDVTAEATATPSPTPESTPETTPEATPEATPESTSETTSDSEDENDEVDTKLWTLLEAYKEYLEEEYYNPEDEDDKVFHESEDDDEYVSVDTCYLVDIDGNGVPEMIYKETQFFHVLTLSDGKVKEFKQSADSRIGDECVRINPKHNGEIFIANDHEIDEGLRGFFCMKNGKLKKVSTIEENRKYYYDNNGDQQFKMKYKVNGKKANKKQYKNEFKKFESRYKNWEEIKYYKTPEKALKKYMKSL